MASSNSSGSSWIPSFWNKEKPKNKPVRYFTVLTGITLDSEKDVKGRLKTQLPNLQEVQTEPECDIILVFCPVVRKPETDVKAALERLNHISYTRPAVLVVLHHTFDVQYVAPDSSRAVNREKTITVNCLFHEDQGLLRCQTNKDSLEKIVYYMKYQIGKSKSEEETMEVDPRDGPAPSRKVTSIFPKKETLKYYTLVTGQTLNTHEHIAVHLKQEISQLKEVHSVNECNFILAFCPVVSRAGTDIEVALMKLNQLSAIKPAVLVVLHRTFDLDYVAPDSRRAVNRGNMIAVDCLFHENMGLLQCKKNSESLTTILNYIKPQIPQSYREKKTETKNRLKYFIYQTENSCQASLDQLQLMSDLQEVKTENECDFILIFLPQDKSNFTEPLKRFTGDSATKPVVLVDYRNHLLKDVLPVISGAVDRANTLLGDEKSMHSSASSQVDRQQQVYTMGQEAGVPSQHYDRQENEIKEPEPSGNQPKTMEMKLQEKDNQIERMKMQIKKLEFELAEKNRYQKEKEILSHETSRQMREISKLLTEGKEQVQRNKQNLDLLEKQMQDKNRQIQEMMMQDGKPPEYNRSFSNSGNFMPS